ncbi:MAG: outer membrane beta-barrel protein [Weeksellaceae bacterium]|nr:outer membrane beta-barrel protein [Weeksellaceae bacterium]
MKKIFMICLTFGFVTLNAQTQKGNWVIEGSTSLGFSSGKSTYKVESDKVDGPTTSVISFNPAAGYFVMDDLAVGIEFGLASVTMKQDSDKVTTSSFSVMPGATYYFSAGENIKPYIGANVGYGSKKEKYEDESESAGGFAWKAKGGMAFFFKESIAVNLGLSYSQMTYDYSEGDFDIKETYSPFGVSVGFSFFL